MDQIRAGYPELFELCRKTAAVLSFTIDQEVPSRLQKKNAKHFTRIDMQEKDLVFGKEIFETCSLGKPIKCLILWQIKFAKESTILK